MEIDEVLNDPNVYPDIALPGEEKLASGALIGDQRNVFLACEGGHAFFVPRGLGIYETMVNFKEGYRGSHALDAMRQAARWMFTRTDCLRMDIRIPATNLGAAWMAREVGATREFIRSDCWVTHDGSRMGMSFWTLNYQDWARSFDGFRQSGVWFFNRMVDECERLKRPMMVRPDDYVIDRLGALAEMLIGGQIDKGVWLYNQFAILAALPLFTVVSHIPPLIDTPIALLQIGDDSFRIVKCHS